MTHRQLLYCLITPHELNAGTDATRHTEPQVLSTLSLLPTLLLAFPKFFSPAVVAPADAKEIAGAGAADLEAPPTASDASTAGDKGGECVAAAAAAAAEGRRRCLPDGAVGAPEPGAAWSRLAAFTRRFALPLTVVLLALLVGPFAYRLQSFRPGLSQSLRNIAPRGEGSIETYYGVQERFSPGALANARLIGVAQGAGVTALSPQFFASAASAVLAVVGASAPGELRAADVSGLAWSNGTAADAGRVAAAVAAVSACPGQSAAACRAACPADACLLRLTAAQTLSSDGAERSILHQSLLPLLSTPIVA